MADKTVGENIRKFRQARHMRQSDLAEKIGKRPNTVGNWELGLRDPGAENIKKIAAALSVSPSELIGHNPDVLQDSSFEVICNDIAMLPEIRPGDRLTVSKGKAPQNGDVVIANVRGYDSRKVDHVIRFFIRVDDMTFLLPADRSFPCEPAERFDILGRVIEVSRKL